MESDIDYGMWRSTRRGGSASSGVDELERLAPHAFDPCVADSPNPRLELAELLARSDLVCVHLPLTDETRCLLSDETLALLGSGPWS